MDSSSSEQAEKMQVDEPEDDGQDGENEDIDDDDSIDVADEDDDHETGEHEDEHNNEEEDDDEDGKTDHHDNEDVDENEEEEDEEEADDNDDDGAGEDDTHEEENLVKAVNRDEGAKQAGKKRERYHVPKIFQDAVTVLIPLDVTADLKIAVQKTRAKRIKSIFKRFPALRKEAKNRDATEDDDPMLGDEEDETAKEKEAKKSVSKKKKLEHVPRPDQFGSVLDYLEAKYVKGVTLEEDDEDGLIQDDKSEGQGSVYSKDSFLDDTDLQRDVAEQVMASTTLTKIELEREDGDFFVNVGNLEVENDEYGDNYDPLQDKENTKATKKKRKKSTASAASAVPSSSSPAAKKTKTTPKPEEPTPAKSKKSTTSTASTKSNNKSATTPKSEKETTERAELQKTVKKTKARLDALYKRGVALIKKLTDEEFPKRKTKLKVALTCPQNKKPGDDITFENPHNPGQRLRVKVPKDSYPGSTFKVTVPVKLPFGDEGKDRNKFPRALQDLLDDFARAYDDWLEAKHEVDPGLNVWKEKQNKFDKLAKEFPSNLITPVDPTYLKLAMRRARQNKYKREKTATASSTKLKELKEEANDEPVKEEEDDSEEDEEEEEQEEEAPPTSRIVDIPGLGKSFPTKIWKESDFFAFGETST